MDAKTASRYAFFRFTQDLKLTSLTLAQTEIKITRIARDNLNSKTLAARQPPERVRRAFKSLFFRSAINQALDPLRWGSP